MKIRPSLMTIVCLLFASCQSIPKGRVVLPYGMEKPVKWTRAEKRQNLAVRQLNATRMASFHMIRLKGAEKPHVHDDHDLKVFMVSGKGMVHVGDLEYTMLPGEALEIPKGLVHWAENQAKDASVVYATFTPPFDGKDYRVIENEPDSKRET